MLAYLMRRLVFAVALIFVASSASLLLTRLAPGDYATQSLGIGASSQQIADLRARYGLERPAVQQYGAWLVGILRFDFGRSFAYDRPVSELIPERAANTAILAVTALAVATIVGLPLGVITGTRRGGIPALIRAISVALLSMPPLLTSLLLVFIAARTRWVPIDHLIVASAALALPVAATFERLQSQAMQDAIGQPYILATMARGVPRGRLVWRDAFRAALRPITSVYGLVIGTLLSGSFVVEMITTWPGLGRLMLEALRARDVYLVVGCAATGAALLAVGTVLSDAALALVDPRARE